MAKSKHKIKGKTSDIEDSRYCSEHGVTFSITMGCDKCREAGYCPYYGKACCC